MSSQSKRLEVLKQRFESPSRSATGGDAANSTRKRHSVYIDQLLMQRVDELYKQTLHEIYPTTITKSAFLEKLLEQGLENLSEIKVALAE